MKKNCMVFLGLILVIFLTGCAGYTTIKAIPADARVYSTDGRLLGATPYSHWDRNLSWAEAKLVIKSEGYKAREVTIKKDTLYIHKIFLPPVLGWPWVMGYEPEYTFELEKMPINNTANSK